MRGSACAPTAFLFLFVASNSIAASWEDLINGERVDAGSRAYRVALAKDLERVVRTLHDATPALTPEQRKWVDGEKARIRQIKDPEVQTKQLIAFHANKAGSRDIRASGFSTIQH